MEPQNQGRAVLAKVKKNQAVYQERFLASGCSASYSNVLFAEYVSRLLSCKAIKNKI